VSWVAPVETLAGSLILLLGPPALTWSIVFATHVVRYVASSAFVELAVQCIPALHRARLNDAAADDAQRRMELRGSLLAGAIFALQFLPVAYAIRAGWTQLYFHVDEHGWAYLPLSFLIALAVHDTYFYWTHRWMHRPGIFRTVHRYHHLSRAPTPWAAFSFHPWESMVQGGIHVLLPFLLPLHASVLGAFVVWATFYSALIHCGHDVFFSRRGRGGLLNTTADHDAHHGGAHGNFALYFSFWDRVMGTCVQLARLRQDRYESVMFP
jgi:Delta7-sterol 5-desaturase